ncbi:MAG: poly-beta-hydroxybutyrate polymerase N-terminal domain-containing protein, partial [Pseudomonadota bacterium]
MKDLSTTPHPTTTPSDTPDYAPSHRPLRQMLAQTTKGSSPASTLAMINDWALHLAMAPDKQMALARTAQAHWISWLGFVAKGCPDAPEARPIQPQKGDRRFNDPSWQSAPFAAMAQGFLLLEDYFDQVTSDIPG